MHWKLKYSENVFKKMMNEKLHTDGLQRCPLNQ